MTDIHSRPFSFEVRTSVRFGAGEAKRLPEYVKEQGFRKVGLMVDSGVAKASYWQEIEKALSGAVEALYKAEGPASEPTYDDLDRLRESFTREPLDGMIGVGGGTALDTAKALSVLITNPGPAIQYRGFNLVKNPGPPVIAIPTTAGTGSEVTPNAVFIDTKEMRKFGINTALYLPKLAILDPLMTVSCPARATISSGMDAIVHAVESYVNIKANPVTRMFSKEAFSLLFNTLPQVVKEPNDVEARARMQLGSYFAVIALMNSGSGPAGAMSYPLGVSYHVPHGIAGAVFLEKVARFNVKQGFTLYADLYDLMAGAPSHLNTKKKSADFCDWLLELCEQLNIPKTLDGFGMSYEEIPSFVQKTMLLKGALDLNPVPFSEENVKNTLEQMFHVNKKETIHARF